MKKVLYIISLFAIYLFLNTLPLLSQGGSNYSIFGIGDIVYGHTAASQAMGGTQIGYSSTNSISILNPALWGKIKTTRVQTGYRFNQNIIDNAEKTLLQNNGAMNGFYSIFNFDTTKEISASLMLQPVSSVNYYMSSAIDPNGNETPGLNGNKLYRGSGGLNNITLGLGTKIIKGLYLGASVSGIIGNIEHSFITDITNIHTVNYQINNTHIISGFNSNIGIYVEAMDNMGIGLFYNITPKGSLEERTEYLYNPTNPYRTRDTVVINKYDVELPNFWGFGISYRFASKLLLAADYLQGNFKNVSIHTAGNDFNNLNRISLGAILLGSDNPYSSLINRTSYKIGAYSEQLYYNVAGKQINEYGITGGIQFPISRTAQIDFSLIIGRRGSLDNGLLQETFGRLIIDVSIGDNWFNPIRRQF
jgi:hypothetical protein